MERLYEIASLNTMKKTTSSAQSTEDLSHIMPHLQLLHVQPAETGRDGL